MSSAFDDILGIVGGGGLRLATDSGGVSLVAMAYLTPMIAKLNQLQTDLVQSWHPTGFYTPVQIRTISQKLLDAQKAVLAPLGGYLADPSTPGKWTANILQSQLLTANSPIIRFVQAAGVADQTGKKFIDAPGFRDAVIGAYNRLVLAAAGLKGLQSFDSWAESAAFAVSSAFTTAATVIKKILGVAAAVASAVLNEVLHLPDQIAMLWKAAKWAAILGGGWFAYKKGTEHRGRSWW